ncbi:hypothetical protein QFC19_001623 [Naganishia cerealis]|uniref:Uncharacterized protein n=1 Tax=Naganishia cerealis TaxID=610337 RepID=A0ACC2WFR3_9TREE|nr:hypothetical protein QFC19_001623 [Naganishia cerealis]
MAAYPQAMPGAAYRGATSPPVGPSMAYPAYRPPVMPQAAIMGVNVPPQTMPVAYRGAPNPQTHYNASSPQPAKLPLPMKGTLAPGEKIKVGNDTVVIDKYLSEGGYAHVYLTHSDTPLGPNKLTTHCLKRLAFRQEQAPDMMKDVEKEIEVMKALRGNPWIVEYLGSEVRRTSGAAGKGPGWEVFILMEFCAGGGIIDLLNKRLRDRLKEQEILSIFVDICEAVAYMHSLPRPLLHRDLKVSELYGVSLRQIRLTLCSNVAVIRQRLKIFFATPHRPITLQVHLQYLPSATNSVTLDQRPTLRPTLREINAKRMNKRMT